MLGPLVLEGPMFSKGNIDPNTDEVSMFVSCTSGVALELCLGVSF